MSDIFRFPDYTWLVETMEIGQFLDLAFTNDSGEVWLFNNDLQMLLQLGPFRELYLQRVAGKLRNNISTVRILIRSDLVDPNLGLEASLKANRVLCERLAEIAKLPGGRQRLSSFYFGVVDKSTLPTQLQAPGTRDDTWIFYAQSGDLDSGIVMLRHRYFPFRNVSQDARPFTIVWMLQHYPVLRDRLKEAFVNYFKDERRFMRMSVTSTAPFAFRLTATSPKTRPGPSTRRRVRSHHPVPPTIPFSLGDQPDVAVMAALPEEIAALKAVFSPEKVRSLPLHPHYEYVILKAKSGPKVVLLTTLLDQGSVPAAIRTWDTIQKWRPKHIILTGVAGGDPDDDHQSLGDIVIANWVIGYERGKVIDGVFRKDSSMYYADELLLQVATSIKNTSWPKRVRERKPSGPNTHCRVHDDLAIGSGSKLVADGAFFISLRTDINRKIKAVEMEADGVGCACDKSDITRVKVLVIKGIMDKSDKNTRDMNPALRKRWMCFAAHAAAVFTREVIREM